MELENIQTLWDEMSAKVDKQKTITDKLIIDMTKDRYRNRINKISTYESLGAVITFITAIGIITNLSKLDTWYLLAAGIFTATYLIVIPFLVLRSISRLKGVASLTNNISQIIQDFKNRRKHFLFIQKLAIYLNFIPLFLSLPVIVKLIDDKDLFVTDTSIWYWYIPVMIIVLVFLSKWGYSHYSRMSESAGKLLNELDN